MKTLDEHIISRRAAASFERLNELETGRAIYAALGLSDEHLAAVSCEGDELVEPALVKAILYRFSEMVRDNLKRPAHRPEGKPTECRQRYALFTSLGIEHERAITLIAKGMKLKEKYVREAVYKS